MLDDHLQILNIMDSRLSQMVANNIIKDKCKILEFIVKAFLFRLEQFIQVRAYASEFLTKIHLDSWMS